MADQAGPEEAADGDFEGIRFAPVLAVADPADAGSSNVISPEYSSRSSSRRWASSSSKEFCRFGS